VPFDNLTSNLSTFYLSPSYPPTCAARFSSCTCGRLYRSLFNNIVHVWGLFSRVHVSFKGFFSRVCLTIQHPPTNISLSVQRARFGSRACGRAASMVPLGVTIPDTKCSGPTFKVCCCVLQICIHIYIHKHIFIYIYIYI